jgi:hypothetical protein
MSSYNSPLPVGSDQATGAYAIAVGNTAAGTTTNGNSTDSAGNVRVDFVWGNHPMHPNDVRTEEAAVNVGGTTGSNQLAYQTAVVTAASASAGVVTYTANNSFNVGQTVTITGLSTSAFNLTNVIIGTLVGTEGARTGFTVTNAATGTAVTGATAVAKVVIGSTPGVGADYAWAATTQVTGDRLNPALDNHVIAEAEWNNYPSFTPGAGNYKVTAASGNGTTVTYTAQNDLAPGDVVNITGLTASAYNLSAATVATANKLSFTVTNSANAGEITGQWYGKVESTTALTAADGAGIAYIVVPSVLGDTTAVALDKLKDAGYETANITTASAATNTLTDITRFNATSATVAVIYATSAHTNYLTGTKVTVVAGTPAGADPVNLPAYALGTWTVTGTAGSGQITVSGSGFTVADTTGVNATDTLAGAAGTIKTQSTAANASSVATTATITVTPYATATA